MKEKIRQHIWLLRTQIMQLERNANEGKITREEAVKGFGENEKIFTERIYADFLEVQKEIQKLFDIEAE